MRPTKADRILHAMSHADQTLAQTIAGVAIALEALESLLVEKDIISKDAMMERIKALVEQKAAAQGDSVPQADGDSRIIMP